MTLALGRDVAASLDRGIIEQIYRAMSILSGHPYHRA
jgi:23S rRNA pseudoU1915 N3-methylase RlmH